MGCGSVSKVAVGQSDLKEPIVLVRVKAQSDSADMEDFKNYNVYLSRSTVFYNKLKHIELMIQNAESDVGKSDGFVHKGEFYFRYAENVRKEYILESFQIFQQALMAYIGSYQLNKANISAIIGIAKSYVRLFHFQKALEHLRNAYGRHKDELSKLAEFWYLYGLSYQKCAKIWKSKIPTKRDSNGLGNAVKCFQEGLAIEPQNVEILKEVQVIERIHFKQKEYTNDIFNNIGQIDSTSSMYEANFERRKSDKETYKILSIDGGGIRCMIPILFLCELEKRSRRRVTDLFNMFIGTSSGAALNCALTVSENSIVPLYTPADSLRQLPRNAHRILQNPSNIRRLYGEKFSSKEAYEITQGTFKDYYLSQTLNDVIIPAVKCDGPLRTVYFTNYEAKKSKEKDFLLKDVLMATTAAPTYYAPYHIPGLGYFLDGGLTSVSSAQKGYEEAIYSLNKNPNDLYVLSLGTGVNTQDMYAEDFAQNKSLLHWITNITNYMMTGQSHDANNFMTSKLGDRYNRFQVYFEDKIPMDTCNYIPDMLDTTTEYIEEKHDEINRIVEILLD